MSKISELSDGGSIQSGDTLIAVRSGGNVKVTYGGTTTADINGGTIDGAVIGGSSAAAGTFTSITGTSANINGTVTADGLTVDGDATVGGASGGKLSIAGQGIDAFATTTEPSIYRTGSGGSDIFAAAGHLVIQPRTNAARSVNIATSADGVSTLKRASFADNGDISFYEDTGTTAKFFWDASAESLGIGTTSPSTYSAELAVVADGSTPRIAIVDDATNNRGGYIESNFSDALVIGTTSGVRSIAFKPDNTERMRITSSGNVGIGNTSPSYKLSVGDGTADTRSVFASNNAFSIGVSNASGFAGWIGGSGVTDNMVFSNSGGTERMRIDSSGNVGIGTSSPNSPIDINRSSTDGTIATFRKDGTTVGSISTDSNDIAIGTNDTGLRFLDSADAIQPYNMTTNATRDNAIDLGRSTTRFKDLYLSGGLRADTLTFSSLAGTERARIDSAGNFIVGTTDSLGGINGASGEGIALSNLYKAIFATRSGNAPLALNRITSDGDIAIFQKNGTTVGSISVTSSTTTYNITSDQRLKDNIVDAPAGNVDDIKVRSFDWKADGSHQEYGMVAQELEDVAPYAVTKGATEDDMWSVDYSKLVPMLIKEIQSLRARVAQLETN